MISTLNRRVPEWPRHVASLLAVLLLSWGGTASAASPRTEIAKPLVPVTTVFQHWDNHWFVWLPGHPVYEAVEIASTNASDGRPPRVWVFFTERDGGKVQVSYYNNPASAGTRTDSYFREMDFEQTQDANGRSVHVGLRDKDNQPVDIVVTVDPAKALVPGGITDQSGHGAQQLFLIMYRARQALASSNRVSVDGKDYSFNSMAGVTSPYPFMAAYSRDVYFGMIMFSAAHVDTRGGNLVHGWGRTFVPGVEGGKSFLQAMPVPGYETIRLDVDSAGTGLLGYLHQAAGHRMQIRFGQPLQAPDAGTSRDIPYSISLDDFRDVVTGNIHVRTVEGAILLTWNQQTPEWARKAPFIVALQPDADGNGYVLSGRAAGASP